MRILSVLLGTAMLAGLAAPAHAAPAAAARPNILILLMDDARTGTTWVMPKSEKWVRAGGSYFPNAVVTTPSCCPSRASLLSGRYAHNHGVTQQSGIGNLDHDRTLEHDLKGAGYRTAAVGKLFNDWNLSTRPPYFDQWALTGGGYNDARFVVDGVETTAPYSTTFVGAQVNKYIDTFESTDTTPWFIYAGFTAPHSPFTPEPQYANVSYPWSGNAGTKETDRTDKPAYVRNFTFTEERGAAVRQSQLRTLRSVDDAVDAIHQRLKARGELDNTLVLLLSDNGVLWGEHALQEKFMPYLEAERVPTMLWWPGHIPVRTDTRLATYLDIAPTVLQAAGLTPSYVLDGRSLLAAGGRSETLEEYWRDASNNDHIPTWSSVYAIGDHMYTELYNPDGTVLDREYYDLRHDPSQLTNLLHDGDPGNDPDLGPLSARLAALRQCSGDTC